MIHIDFKEPDTPAWRQWRTECEDAQERLNNSVEAGPRMRVKDHLYKGVEHHIREDVFFDRDGPFRGKCVYCETKISPGQHGNVEHFRPHAKVTDSSNNSVSVTINGTATEHPGYYWLAYDWQNLLPACELCNQPSTIHSGGSPIGKRNQFPVAGFRAAVPGDETREEPLLIHPVIDFPEQHLRLDDVCAFEGLDNRGKTTIGVLGLNDRDLPNERMEVYRTVRQKFGLLLQVRNHAELRESAPALLTSLLALKNGSGAHTAAARKAIIDAIANADTLKQELASATEPPR